MPSGPNRTPCAAKTKTGGPCGSFVWKSGPDPDGKWRCAGHSKHPDCVAARGQQAAAGAREAMRRQKAKQAKRKLAVDPDILRPETTSDPEPPPARGRVSKIPHFDFATPRGRKKAITWAAHAVLTEQIVPLQAKAIAELANAATKADANSGGGSREHHTWVLTEVDKAAPLAIAATDTETA